MKKKQKKKKRKKEKKESKEAMRHTMTIIMDNIGP